MPIGWQIIVRFQDDRVLTPTLAYRRRFAASVARSAAPFPLLAFSAADTHAHFLTTADRPAAGELARRLLIGLHQVLEPGSRFEPARIVPVHDQRHLRHGLDYVLGQHAHHGITADPLLEASNLPDLLGLRLNARFTAGHVRQRLPRVGRAALQQHLALDPSPEHPLDPTALAPAARSALALNHLDVRTTIGRLAAAAAVQVAREHLRPGEVAARLELVGSTERRLRRVPTPASLRAAVAAQWRLRSQLPPHDPSGTTHPPQKRERHLAHRLWPTTARSAQAA